MSANQDGFFRLYENVGVNPNDFVGQDAATFHIYENQGVGPGDFTSTIVGQQPVGWGVNPTPLRDVRILNSQQADFRLYEYDVP